MHPQPPSPSPEKLVADAAESASSLTPEEPLVEFLDTTLSEEWIPASSGTASPLKELLNYTSLEGSNTTGPETVPSSEKFVAGAVESVPAVQELDFSSLNMLEFQNQRLLVTQPPPTPVPPLSGKLGTGSADFAPAVPLQVSASFEESITASSETESHSHSSGSYGVSTCSCEKPVAGAAEFASEQALQDANVASSKELLDTTSFRELSHEKFVVVGMKSMPAVQDRQDSEIDKVISKLLSEQSITISQQKMPHNTTDASQQPASSAGFKILTRCPQNCCQEFYIRMDQAGYFWTYPDVGGPFNSVCEADIAIKCFVDELWLVERCNKQDEFSYEDRIMHDRRSFLYGPPMKHPNSPSSKTIYDGDRYLIQALLDQYNADNNLFGNFAHELEDILRKQIVPENPWWYYHLNFTTKQQADDSTGNKLFFAELAYTLGDNTWEVNCCCIIETQDDYGGHCNGCRNKSDRMRHPKDTNAYAGGHLDAFCWLTKHKYEEDDGDMDDSDMEDDNVDVEYGYDVEDDDDMEGYNVGETRGRTAVDKWIDCFLQELV